MSSIEERLVRDIAAVTGGIIVTDSDLREARDEVIDRIESDSHRRRVRTGVMVAAAVVVVAVGGVAAYELLGDDSRTVQPVDPSPSINDPDADYLTGSDPTPQLVAGVWRLDNGGVMAKFTEDGSIRLDDHGRLFSHPATIGIYDIDGDQITITAVESSQPECVGKTFSMRASVLPSGVMRFVPPHASDPCAPVPPVEGPSSRCCRPLVSWPT